MALTTQNSNSIIVPCAYKPVGPPHYAITVFDPETAAWDLLDPVLDYPDGLPLFCHLASCDGELVALGGWDPATYEPVADVFAYDFAAQGGVAMPRRASFFTVGTHDGRVYMARGHNEGKNALRLAWAYNVGRGEWAELPLMSHGRDKCEGVVAAEGRSFWVVSGYGTEDQGLFKGSADVYDFGTGGMAESGEGVAAKAGLDPVVRAETCRVELGGGRTLVAGAEYEGGWQGFYMEEGQNKKLERINVPDKFSEFAWTGCHIEI
ncbi:hypothetical protein EUGRSUZ_J01812 [Eucalyptus grandis]|uniref:Uncharacterized protein n=2 Tax=Eucalyptus grandis TaxID=71139 RepID=A0ACC3J675_EUCGR|nr:hypothetical protein EUGRSUZ_J01812 [Eucalyptus grandis]